MSSIFTSNPFEVLANYSEEDQQSEESDTKIEIPKVTVCTKRSKPDDENDGNLESYPKKQSKRNRKNDTERNTRDNNEINNPILTNSPIPPAPADTTLTILPSQENYKQIEDNLKFSMGQRHSFFGDSFNHFVRFKNSISLIVKRCHRVYEFVTKGSDAPVYPFENADDNDIYSCHNNICRSCTLLDRCDKKIICYPEKPLTPEPSKENKIMSRRYKQTFNRNFEEQLDPSDLLKSYNNLRSDYINNTIPLNGPIQSLALLISFGGSKIEYPVEEFHKFGFHPIFKSFAKYTNIEVLRKFVLKCAINCWANAWKIVIVILSNSNINIGYISCFVKELRNMCDRLVLDIIVVHTFLGCVSNEKEKLSIEKSGTSAVIYRHSNYDIYLLQELLNYFVQSIRTSYNDRIYFYNKDESYYEFTNFFRSPVKIDDLDWPTTENYFQAQKFHKHSLRETIRNAWSAREAFAIARRNNYLKRCDWEYEDPQKGIFKERVMQKALFAKFRQHENLKYKLLSTSTALLYEHTENDKYWGDGGKFGKGLNRLGYFLMEVRNQLMKDEIGLLADEYIGHNEKWIVYELRELDNLG
ncbi:10132_t:CDS:2 [Gigaspora margarita]|uniref:10132_t:CDS:1 n=1 Tax=Gigaspora margarita TaxID=4874 RepID=A0ABN7VQU4_GIGMA|nr:10132_t:CDS:2 [Gigaspora margarita]